MPLAVLGAGFPRTGTLSLKLALEKLGFGPCHHMAEIFQHPEEVPLWTRAFNEDGIDWDEVLAGYNSATDAPSCFAFPELAARYPKAKVILSIRSAESWWKSASATVMQAGNRNSQGAPAPPPSMLAMFESLGKFMARHNRPHVDPMNATPETSMAAFNAHNERVRRIVPAERLLVFEAKQGWEPLCKFLGVPIPEIPYPRINTTEEFLARAPLLDRGEVPALPKLS
jgi:hypothetical protein